MFDKSLALFNEVRNKWGQGIVSASLGELALATGAYGSAERHFKQALVLGRDTSDKDSIGTGHGRLGRLFRAQGDYEQAAMHFEQQLMLFRQLDNPSMIADGLFSLGQVELALGKREQATQRFEDVRIINRENGDTDQFMNSSALYGLGQVARARKDFATAHALHRESLDIRRELHDKWALADSFDALAVVAADQGCAQHAARLFGASETLYALIRFAQSPYERDLHERAVKEARAQLGEETFAAAWAGGAAMTLDQAVAYALADER
jgi:tetratricopeptide (TPR) repeat protein